MLLGLASRIYRDRRRLFFVVSMAFLSGIIMYLRSDLHVGGLHISWITGAIYAGVIGFCAVFVCLFVPTMRFMIEAVAVSRFCLSVSVFAVPELERAVLGDPVLTSVIVVSGGFLISRVMHGRILRAEVQTWRDRILPKITMQRGPVQIKAGPMQTRYVAWIDNAVPIAP